MIPWLDSQLIFPDPSRALQEPNGLLAAGGDLTTPRLLAAYRQGIFPWFSPGDPILWWSPDPRMVLIPSEINISRSLRKTIRHKSFDIRFNTVFEEVIRACAAPRYGQSGTWIVEDMIAAYCRLHQEGHAHSVECWAQGQLVGGLYGVAVGRMFFGESMFSRATDASKLALVALAQALHAQGFHMIDCQMYTDHLASMGARPMQRADFLLRLKEAVQLPTPYDLWCDAFELRV
ncbi:leucyl/phenylalanyl-tRNA--protein transferase [Leeia oryzae]|uniref:leucyl/phenylalanyl-tRNA--protein transferase n=1 Tax=Leeia oryzae TaxID=356662 RepID=UPI000477277C|nr:leucyl/phenylalanyl-tRNA--protein transferase [Leeia oryzae]